LKHAEAPNQVWCADFKGWFLTQDGVRCDPLTITDAPQPLPVAVLCGEENGWAACLGRVRGRLFASLDYRKRFRTDNGSPFGQSELRPD